MNDKNLDRGLQRVRQQQDIQKTELDQIRREVEKASIRIDKIGQDVQDMKEQMVTVEDVKKTVKKSYIYTTLFCSALAIAGAGYVLMHRGHNGYCKCNLTRIETLSNDLNKIKEDVNKELEETQKQIGIELEQTQEQLGNEISGIKSDMKDLEKQYNEGLDQIQEDLNQFLDSSSNDELEGSNKLDSENQSNKTNANDSLAKENTNSNNNKGQSQASNSSRPSNPTKPTPSTPTPSTPTPSTPTPSTPTPSTPTPSTPTPSPSTPTPSPSTPPHEHKYELVEEVKATCTTDGYKVYKCSADGSEKREVIPALGHTAGEPVSKTEGNTVVTTTSCTRCGIVLDQQAHEHKYELAEEVKATCTTDGYKVYKCSVDGSQKREVIPALGHTAGEPQERPGDNNTIIKETTCTHCGIVLSSEVITKPNPDKNDDITIGGEGESGIGGDDVDIFAKSSLYHIDNRSSLIAQLQNYKEMVQNIEFASNNEYETTIGTKVYHM